MTNNEYKALMRRKLLESIYDKMDDREKLVFIQMTMQNADHQEIMNALQQISKQVDNSKHSWVADFGANIAGNAVFDGATWLLAKVLKKL